MEAQLPVAQEKEKAENPTKKMSQTLQPVEVNESMRDMIEELNESLYSSQALRSSNAPHYRSVKPISFMPVGIQLEHKQSRAVQMATLSQRITSSKGMYQSDKKHQERESPYFRDGGMWSPRVVAEQTNAHKLFLNYRRGSGILNSNHDHLFLPPDLEQADYNSLSGHKNVKVDLEEIKRRAFDSNPIIAIALEAAEKKQREEEKKGLEEEEEERKRKEEKKAKEEAEKQPSAIDSKKDQDKDKNTDSMSKTETRPMSSGKPPLSVSTTTTNALVKDERMKKLFSKATPIHRGDRFRTYDGELLWTQWRPDDKELIRRAQKVWEMRTGQPVTIVAPPAMAKPVQSVKERKKTPTPEPEPEKPEHVDIFDQKMVQELDNKQLPKTQNQTQSQSPTKLVTPPKTPTPLPTEEELPPEESVHDVPEEDISTFYEQTVAVDEEDSPPKIYVRTNQDHIKERMDGLKQQLKVDSRYSDKVHIVTLPWQIDIFRAFYQAAKDWTEIYECPVYDFAHFLIEQKLNMAPDPLLEPKKSKFLADGGYIENYMYLDPKLQCEQPKVHIVFTSEFECGNLGSVFVRMPHVPGQRPVATSSDGTQQRDEMKSIKGSITPDAMRNTNENLTPLENLIDAHDLDPNRDEEYVLIVQSDHNSKGYQQWFSFLCRGFKPDKRYKFHIGGFKKPISKFASGMLPFICLLNQHKRGHDDSLAQDILSNVKYTKWGATNLQDLGVTDDTLDDLNFQRKHKYVLSFTVQFTLELLDKWQVNEAVLPHMCFYFSYAYPYSYTRMKTILLPKIVKYATSDGITQQMEKGKVNMTKREKRLDEIREKKANSSAMKYQMQSQTYGESGITFDLKSIGRSLCGLDIPIIVIKKREQGIVLSKTAKKIIVVLGRSHPSETPASYLVEGFLEKLLAGKNKEYWPMFSLCEVHVIPMLNPDGVVVGNSRTNLSGTDLNRRWGEQNKEGCVTPEVNLLKDYIFGLGERVFMFIEVEGHSMVDGLSFVMSQASNIVQKIKTNEAVDADELDAWFWQRALPRWMHLNSQFSKEATNTYYTAKDDRVRQRHRSSRCVNFHDLGVLMSMTLEISFFGFTNKKDPSQFVVFNQQGIRDAGADLIPGLYQVLFLDKKLSFLNNKGARLSDFLSDLSLLRESRLINMPQKVELEQFSFMLDLFDRMQRLVDNKGRTSVEMEREVSLTYELIEEAVERQSQVNHSPRSKKKDRQTTIQIQVPGSQTELELHRRSPHSNYASSQMSNIGEARMLGTPEKRNSSIVIHDMEAGGGSVQKKEMIGTLERPTPNVQSKANLASAEEMRTDIDDRITRSKLAKTADKRSAGKMSLEMATQDDGSESDPSVDNLRKSDGLCLDRAFQAEANRALEWLERKKGKHSRKRQAGDYFRENHALPTGAARYKPELAMKNLIARGRKMPPSSEETKNQPKKKGFGEFKMENDSSILTQVQSSMVKHTHLISQLEAANKQVTITPFDNQEMDPRSQDFEISSFVSRARIQEMRGGPRRVDSTQLLQKNTSKLTNNSQQKEKRDLSAEQTSPVERLGDELEVLSEKPSQTSERHMPPRISQQKSSNAQQNQRVVLMGPETRNLAASDYSQMVAQPVTVASRHSGQNTNVKTKRMSVGVTLPQPGPLRVANQQSMVTMINGGGDGAQSPERGVRDSTQLKNMPGQAPPRIVTSHNHDPHDEPQTAIGEQINVYLGADEPDSDNAKSVLRSQVEEMDQVMSPARPDEIPRRVQVDIERANQFVEMELGHGQNIGRQSQISDKVTLQTMKSKYNLRQQIQQPPADH